jgi:hypothetical protein
MNALAGYGSDSESEEEGSTAQVNENKATVEPIETPIVEAPTNNHTSEQRNIQ